MGLGRLPDSLEMKYTGAIDMAEPKLMNKKLEDLLKVGVVMLAMVVGFFMGRYSNVAPPVSDNTSAVQRRRARPITSVGEKLSLPGTDWAKNQRTLVLALQIGCHFCSESSSFYQKLVQERSHFGKTQFVAVLPQPVENSTAYLNKLGVSVDEIRQGSLGEIGVQGTPTLLLVNSAGVVTEAWDGKLQPEQEQSVFARLQIK